MTMATIYRKFNAGFVELILRSPPPGPKEFRDRDHPELMLRVLRGGGVHYYVTANVRGEGSTRLSIGNARKILLADARTRAREMQSKMMLGEVPVTKAAEERERVRQRKEAEAAEKAAAVERVALKATLFVEITRRYCVHCRHIRLRSAHDKERDIERLLMPHWRERQIGDIKRDDMVEIITALVANGKPAMARNIYAGAKALFSWAIEAGLAPEPSPCTHIKIDTLVGKARVRERVLTDAELGTVWSACVRIGYPVGSMVRMLLFTGLDLRQVAHAMWHEVDVPGAKLTVPPERSRRARALPVPLAPAVMELIERSPNRTGYIFVKANGLPIVGFSPPKQLLDETIAALGQTMPPWQFSDLRRTVQMRLCGLPGSQTVRSLMVGGVKRSSDLYSYEREVHDLAVAWSERLLAVVHRAH
jgi:hypothetical protein